MGFDDSLDVTKCLQQIEIPDLLHKCAPGNEQPSNIKTMVQALDCTCPRAARRAPRPQTPRSCRGGSRGWHPVTKPCLPF